MSQQERALCIRQVAYLQNHPANLNQDHMTICGFFTKLSEFDAHVISLEARIDRYESS